MGWWCKAASTAELGKISIGRIIAEKKDHISTHTARRFATTAYLSRSIQVYEIMNCTRHKSESSFLKYLKLDGMDYANWPPEASFYFNDRKLLKLSVVA